MRETVEVSYAALLCLVALTAHCGSDSNANASGRAQESGVPADGALPVGVSGAGTGGAAPGNGLSSEGNPSPAGIDGTTAIGGTNGGNGGGGASAGDAADAAGGPAAGVRALDIPFDWNGIVGTGQSLSVGEPGDARNTQAGTVRLTAPSFRNLKLSTSGLPWPVDASDATLAMVPLTEPLGRIAPAYPSSWPENIAFNGETPHAAMANQLTASVAAAGAGDFVSVHGAVGENGQCLIYLAKDAVQMGLNGRAYEATLVETRAITRLAQAAGRTYGVRAITVTHGECDAGDATYGDRLYQLWEGYSIDLPAITGQAEPPLMIISQQNSSGERSASTLAAWRLGVEHPSDVVCSGPKYQYPYSSDYVHLIVDGYELLGEKYAQVLYERELAGSDWQPLQPTTVARAGRVVSVQFHVPVPPLVWEDTFQLPHQTSLAAWSAGQGFELRDGAGAPLTISSVAIQGDTVQVTAAADLPAVVIVGYAMSGSATEPMTAPFTGTLHWGRLRDSDPFVGATTQRAQPNFAVAFELPVP
jgi:hypothetical protein